MNKSSQIAGSIVSSSDLIDAKLEEQQFHGLKVCPSCGHKLEGKPDWVGLPAGVKFDPTDQELIEHLEAKVESKASKSSHPLIDEFIPTIDGEDGICYTHPEKLPGVTRDGLSRHFFHRPSKAYTTGTRKRRKIQMECDLQGGETRWHKTGKTRPVLVNGKQKGCKKILVLYTNFGKNRKPEKTNWVMHQYHLGQHEEERDGELVVSKIFYQTQPRQCNWSSSSAASASDKTTAVVGVVATSVEGNGSTRSKEIIINHVDHDQLSAAAALAGFSSLNLPQLMKSDDFSYADPFRKGFDEVGVGEASTAREEVLPAVVTGTCDGHELQGHPAELHHHHQRQQTRHDHDHHQQQQQQTRHDQLAMTTAFQISSRPSHTISSIVHPSASIHHSPLLHDDDSFHVSRIMALQNENFQVGQQQEQQQQQQQQQHHKLERRSASGLEELIMSYISSSSSDQNKQESSVANPQDTEWMKFNPFWPDPDNSDHNG